MFEKDSYLRYMLLYQFQIHTFGYELMFFFFFLNQPVATLMDILLSGTGSDLNNRCPTAMG